MHHSKLTISSREKCRQAAVQPCFTASLINLARFGGGGFHICGAKRKKISRRRHDQNTRPNPARIRRRPGNDSDEGAIAAANNARRFWETHSPAGLFPKVQAWENFAGRFDSPKLAGRFASTLRGRGFHRQTAQLENIWRVVVKDFPSGKSRKLFSSLNSIRRRPKPGAISFFRRPGLRG